MKGRIILSSNKSGPKKTHPGLFFIPGFYGTIKGENTFEWKLNYKSPEVGVNGRDRNGEEGVNAMGKLILRLLLGAFLVWLLMAATALADDDGMVEKVGQGEIDWTNGLIHVVGYGVPPKGVTGSRAKLMARGAAKTDAYRNAAEVINQVRVNSQFLVADYVRQSELVRLAVEGFVRGARIIRVNQQRDGRIELTIELPLGGQAGLVILLNRPEVTGLSAPELPAPSGAAEETSRYTGVIIDARNLKVKPALYPRVLDQEGNLLYASTMVNMARPGFTTLVAYARSLEAARKLPRLGKNPVVLTPEQDEAAPGEQQTDLVLGEEAAKAFRALPAEVIQNGAVVFLID